MTLNTEFAGKSDAELMQFCAETSRALGNLSWRIQRGGDLAPKLELRFTAISERLGAALDELDSRYSDTGALRESAAHTGTSA